MTNRIYSAFDPSALGAGLDLSATNTILTVAETTDIYRTARALYGKSSGTWSAEFMVWGEGTLAGYASVGLVDAMASLETYVGGDSHGVGYRIGDGKIYIGGASVDTVVVGVPGDIVCINLTFASDGTGTVVFKLNTVPISTQTLAAGTYYLAATIAGAQANDLFCFLNCGQRGFENGTASPGWYIVQTTLNPIYIGSGEYITAPDDDPPSVPFDSAIVSGQSFAIARQLNFRVWNADSLVVPATSTISIQNPGGEFERLLSPDSDMVDRTVQLQLLDSEDVAYSTATAAGDFVISKLSASDENTLSATIKDAIALLDVPIQNHLILPNAEADAINQPWGIVLGAARNVPLTLLDAENNVYAVSDVPVVGFGYVRDKGDPFNPNASPPDYTINTARTQIMLGSQAQGIVTGDFSSIGGGTDPIAADDIWNGSGNPFTGTVNSTPTGWANGGYGAATPKLLSGNRVQFANNAPSMKTSATATMLAGRSYRVTMTVISAASGTTAAAADVVKIGIGHGRTSFIWSVPGIPGRYSTVITNAGIDFEPILFTYDASIPGYQGANVVLKDVSLLEIADVYVPSNITPIKLGDFVEKIMTLHARATGISIPYSRADADAIDAVTGYAGIGFYDASGITTSGALSLALPSWCAGSWMDKTGTLRFTRLAIPEEETATVFIDESDMLGDLSIQPDPMKGLSTRVGYRRNWKVLGDSDFVTDFIDVPWSTRRALSQDYQGIAATAAALAPTYAHAVFAKPYASLLDSKEDAQNLADYLGRMAGKKRDFYTCDLPAGMVSMGQIANVTHKRYGLTAGKNLQVVEIIERTMDDTETVTFRG